MDSKPPWHHRFMTKECFIILFVGIIFGAWTMWYHMRPALPPAPEPPEDSEPACHDMMVRGSFTTICPNSHHRISSFGDAVLCTCLPKK